MRVVEIVYEGELKTFGLEIGEVVEIVKETAKELDGVRVSLEDWDENGKFRFSVKMHPGSTWLEEHPKDFMDVAVREFNNFFEKLENRLKYYSSIKPFLHIYSKNGNGTGEVREIFEKAGIEVIS